MLQKGRIIKKLTRKKLLSQKQRNLVVICAICLTTILFTAVCTVYSILTKNYEINVLQQVGTSEHASLKRLNEEQLVCLTQDPEIKCFGISSTLGSVSLDGRAGWSIAMMYADHNEAEFLFCKPSVGRMPSETESDFPEIAIDCKILEIMGSEATLGDIIALTYMLDNGEFVTDEFRICGIWEHNPVSKVCLVFIPRYYNISVRKNHIFYDEGEAIWNIGIKFRKSKNLEEQTIALINRNGYSIKDEANTDGIRYGVNDGYFSTGADMLGIEGQIAVIVLILVGIMTGYLIISNIFSISITNDVRFYGMMRTIGMTSRQIKNMVMKQGVTLCLFGLPVGLGIGFLVGKFFTSIIVANVTNTYLSENAVTLNPFVFLLSACFSVLTVMVSCVRPAMIASESSSIMALKYTEGEKTRKIRHRRKVSVLSLAWRNVVRKKSKALKVVFSLVLASLLFQISYCFALGFDLEKCMQNYSKDVIISSKEYFSYDISEESAPNELERLTGLLTNIKAEGAVYGTSGVGVYLSEEQTNTLMHRYGILTENQEIVWSLFADEEDEKERNKAVNGAGLYGFDDTLLSELNVLQGSTLPLLETNRNAIAVVRDIMKDNPDELFGVGDIITLSIPQQKGEEIIQCPIDYEVCAIIDIPVSLSYRCFREEPYFLVSYQTMLRDGIMKYQMLYAFDCGEEWLQSNVSTIEAFINGNNTNLAFETSMEIREQFAAFRNTFLIVVGALVVIIGLIGIMNLANILITGIVERRKELAIMQAVGMTGKQLCIMLLLEGVIYTGIAFAITLLISGCLGELLFETINHEVDFLSLRNNFAPLISLLPIYVLIGATIPYFNYRKISKESIIESMDVQ